MNKTKIQWTDYTWNPITGCNNGCGFCYARKITKRFPKNFPDGFTPHFYTDRLMEPTTVKKPSKIFTVSMGDMFSHGVRLEWINSIIRTIELCPQHTFQILTKSPQYITGKFPKNVWLGVSINKPCDIWRLYALNHYGRIDGAPVRFISFEPLLEHITREDLWLGLGGVDLVVIGWQTAPLKKCDDRSVREIIDAAREKEVKVFLKPPLYDYWKKKYGEDLQELPECSSKNI